MTQAEAYKIISDHYKNNFKKLVNRTIGKVGNRSNAEDAIQEAYTRALTYWESFDPNNTFDSWFDGIMNNSIRNVNTEVRSKGMANPDLIDPIIDLEQGYFKRFLKEIRKDISELPEDKRKLISMAFLEGYTPLDISRITNKTVNAIRIILFRFREEIKFKYGSSLYGRS